MTKKNKGNKKKLFFGPDKDYSLLLRISIHNGESGSRIVLHEKLFEKKNTLFEEVDISPF